MHQSLGRSLDDWRTVAGKMVMWPRSGGVSVADQPFGRRHPTLLVPVLGVSGTLVYLEQSVVLPLLPVLPARPGATESSVSWVVIATLVVGATATPVAARLGDVYGKRRMLLGCLTCLVVGSTVCAVSPGLGMLIAGRAVQGWALGLLPLSIAVVRDELPPARVAWGVGLLSSTSAVGIAVGPVLPGPLGDFRVTFWVLAALGAVVLVLVQLCVAGLPSRQRRSLDVVGGVLLTVVLSLLFLPLSKGNDWGWSSPLVLVLSCCSCSARARCLRGSGGGGSCGAASRLSTCGSTARAPS